MKQRFARVTAGLHAGAAAFIVGLSLNSLGCAPRQSPSQTPAVTIRSPPSSTASTSAAVFQPRVRALAVAVGGDHSCALVTGGGVWCWGHNDAGQLGDGTVTNRYAPVWVSAFRSGARAVFAGFAHTCALNTAGAWCWGNNAHGALGDGSTASRAGPVEVSGLSSKAATIAEGLDHTCALSRGGGVECWGWNGFGQLGDGTTTDRHGPIGVSGLGSGMRAIAAGWTHSCALSRAGGVWCWGDNSHGQLGDGTTTERHRPVEVSGLGSGATAIAAGEADTCVLTRGGGVECWGWNGFGQLGDGTTTDRRVPVQVSGLSSGVAAIAVGAGQACALTRAGGIQCWGDNQGGDLGDGTTTERHTPVQVSGLSSGMAAIAAGEACTCAVTTAGRVECWGDNQDGDLGDGTATPSSIPVEVSGL